ncbi:NAD(P)-binding protein [bacterium]|nr:NAD(P)-binding protein [bacterium]
MLRRSFFKTSFYSLLATQLPLDFFSKQTPKISGKIVGTSKNFGHLLRSGIAQKIPSKKIKTSVAIVGGGISGLSAGWKFKKTGFSDFLIFELEKNAGGNSSFGENKISKFPWAAHYLPVPTEESKAVLEVLEDFGAINSYTVEGIPVYRKDFLTRKPEERIFVNGTWQEGLFPYSIATKEDLKQYLDFTKICETYKNFRDKEGRKGFAIPLRLSSPEFFELDKISMSDFLKSKGLNSKLLTWFVNYGMRDDYGGTIENVSAWAGIHYFVSRTGKNGYGKLGEQLTWQEGNGWLTQNFTTLLEGKIQTQHLLFEIKQTENKVLLKFLNTENHEVCEVESDFAVLALPKFMLKYFSKEFGEKTAFDNFDYSSWLVANLTVTEIPQNEGVKPCWDNVIFESDSLGYVIATHQKKRNEAVPSVLTYYFPFCKSSKTERNFVNEKSWEDWKTLILDDLKKAHGGIEKLVTNIDLMVLGHGMVRPKVNFIWNDEVLKLSEPLGKIYLAHSDLSGISIFEEANFWGVFSAQKILGKLGINFKDSLK